MTINKIFNLSILGLQHLHLLQSTDYLVCFTPVFCKVHLARIFHPAQVNVNSFNSFIDGQNISVVEWAVERGS